MLIVPGILFAIFYAYSVFAVIIDGKKGNSALRYSKDVVTSDVWRYIGNITAAWLVTLPCYIIIHLIVTLLFGDKTGNNIGLLPTTGEALTNLCGVVISVYVMIFSYLLYEELKKQVKA